MLEEFAGKLMAFNKKGEGEQSSEAAVLIEVTDFKKDGTVEIAFNDRDERIFIQFDICDVMKRIASWGS